MIFAHLPAGYIVSTLLLPRFQRQGLTNRQNFIGAGLLGAIAPDFDLIYFYGFDHLAHPHHSYVTHFPIVWLSLLMLAGLSLQLANRKQWPALATTFALNGLLHMLLDFVASNIYWLAPWRKKPFSLLEVPSVYDPWWLNFLLYRSFVLELLIVTWAVYLWRRQQRQIACLIRH
jgi:inner membrane protein